MKTKKILEIFQNNLFREINIFTKGGFILKRILIKTPESINNSIFAGAYKTIILEDSKGSSQFIREEPMSFVVKYAFLRPEYISKIKTSLSGDLISFKTKDPYFLRREQRLYNDPLCKKVIEISRNLSD